jgi:tetratricopeptide (TPR) repeat protein
MTAGHSTFTPSDPDKLEALFVARESLARSLMASIRDSALTDNKHQRLLVGPRGIGKTHLIALINHRVRADAELTARLRIAWLPEDPYVPGYAQLLALILRRLRDDEPDLGWLGERLEAVLDVADTGHQEAMLEGLIAEALQDLAEDPARGRALLLLVENLDDLLADLRQDGQRKLRALIQNTGRVAILATTTSLTDPLTDQKEAFYGFFRTQRLEPFGAEDAAALLARLAEHAGDTALADLIWSPLGLARVRAVHYLAGGNPRVYVIFHDFLSRESLDELVRPFTKLMDELTPYYQSRMARLAPLQRGIVDTLRRLRVAVPVKTIAREVMVTPQSVSTQLGKLLELGYVLQADSIGRNNYYELREPLMRLCLDVKEQRGETIPLFIDFLRIWYSNRELTDLAGDAAGRALERAHLLAAVEQAKSEPDPLRASLEQTFLSAMQEGDLQRALAEIDCALARDPNDKICWVRKADCLEKLNAPLEDQLACWRRVSEAAPEASLGWSQQGIRFDKSRDVGKARQGLTPMLGLTPDDPELSRNHAWKLQRFRRSAEARWYLARAIKLECDPESAAGWHARGQDLQDLDRHAEALQAFGKALVLEPRREDAWSNLVGALQEQGRYRTYRRITTRLTELMPESARLHAYQGFANRDQGDFDAALAAYDRALALDPGLDRTGTPVTLWKATELASSGRVADALGLLREPQPDCEGWAAFRRSVEYVETLLWLDRWDEGRAELDRTLAETQPEGRSGRDLTSVRWLPARTQSPPIWRRHIALWLELFGKHGLLTELGEALVRSLRTLAIDWIPDQNRSRLARHLARAGPRHPATATAATAARGPASRTKRRNARRCCSACRGRSAGCSRPGSSTCTAPSRTSWTGSWMRC